MHQAPDLVAHLRFANDGGVHGLVRPEQVVGAGVYGERLAHRSQKGTLEPGPDVDFGHAASDYGRDCVGGQPGPSVKDEGDARGLADRTDAVKLQGSLPAFEKVHISH